MSDVAVVGIVVGIVAAIPPSVLAGLAWMDHRKQIGAVKQAVEQTCAQKLDTALGLLADVTGKLEAALKEIARLKRSRS